MDIEDIDTSGLMHECYRISGITPAECRSIFLDWLLKLPAGVNPSEAIDLMIGHYGGGAPDHPMTQVLREGRDKPVQTGRRGGRKSRINK